MQFEIERGKEASVLYDGKFWDTGVPLQASFSEVFRLSRSVNLKAQWDRVKYDPEVFHGKRFFSFGADVDMTSGFGGVSYNLLKESIEKYQIAWAGRSLDLKDPRLFALRNRDLIQEGAMVWHDQPRANWADSPFAKNIAIVPFETTEVPHSWIARLNAFDALLVPCEQNIQAFKDSGVKIPIELIHWGIDPEKFYPLAREERPVFTFGTMGYLTVRKGTDILVDAFREAFPVEQDVKLICKTSCPAYPFDVPDKRIEVQRHPVSHHELITEFAQRIDCFVFPTRGEGFGLTPLEMMATGVPAIVTGWAGPLEYMTPETGWLIDYTMEPATVFTQEVYKEECGDWAEPSKAHLVELMRYAYEHRDEVKQKGIAAAKHVQENWLWKDKIGMFHDALEKYL